MRIRKRILATCICAGIVSVLSFWQVSGWKATLRKELHRCQSEGDGLIFPSGWSYGAGTVSLFRLPATAATILESHRREDLLPYLSELAKSTNDLHERSIISYCTLVVTRGLRGAPGIVEYTVALGSKTKKISVFDYCLQTNPNKQDTGAVMPAVEQEEEIALLPRNLTRR